jgi:hypothetical protein
MLDPSIWMSSPYSIQILPAIDGDSALICQCIPGVLELNVVSL